MVKRLNLIKNGTHTYEIAPQRTISSPLMVTYPYQLYYRRLGNHDIIDDFRLGFFRHDRNGSDFSVKRAR